MSHCEWGICECDFQHQKLWGQCSEMYNNEPLPGRGAPFKKCLDSTDCFTIDINLICSEEDKQGRVKTCQCRKDMMWNKKMLECQVVTTVNSSN